MKNNFLMDSSMLYIERDIALTFSLDSIMDDFWRFKRASSSIFTFFIDNVLRNNNVLSFVIVSRWLHLNILRLRNNNFMNLPWTWDLDMHAVLESDSQVLVNALCNDTTFLSSNGLLIEDIRHHARFFNQLDYSHVKRECNKVTYKLARHVLFISDFVVWMEDVLPPLFPIILAYITRFS